jgi:hypothetical protein
LSDGLLDEVISVVARLRRWTLVQKLALVEEVLRPGERGRVLSVRAPLRHCAAAAENCGIGTTQKLPRWKTDWSSGGNREHNCLWKREIAGGSAPEFEPLRSTMAQFGLWCAKATPRIRGARDSLQW